MVVKKVVDETRNSSPKKIHSDQLLLFLLRKKTSVPSRPQIFNVPETFQSCISTEALGANAWISTVAVVGCWFVTVIWSAPWIVHMEFAGNPVQVRFSLVERPLSGVTVRISGADWPGTTVICVVLVDIVKSGLVTTMEMAAGVVDP